MKESGEETVALYRYVHNHPGATFDDIVEKAMPPAMRNAAYQAYRAHRLDEPGEELPDEWFAIDRNKNVAWRWWIGELVHSSVNTKRLSVDTQDGSPVRGKRRQSLVYSIGPRKCYVLIDGKKKAWTPDLDKATKRAAAAMRVTQRGNQAINDLMGDKPTRKQLDAAIAILKDALEALHLD